MKSCIESSLLNSVTKFWFPGNSSSYQDFWFSHSKDDEIKILFEKLLIDLEIQEIDDLKIIIENNLNYLLPIVICFDQFSRNIYRSQLSPKKTIYHNDIKCFAEAEGLSAHARSASVRFEDFEEV